MAGVFGAPFEQHNGSISSNASNSPASSGESGSKKRTSGQTGLDDNGNKKPVKRRATKACAACRARKVRCDVMQRYHVTADGEITCSNCTMDGIKCVIEESKRRKKHLQNGTAISSAPQPLHVQQNWGNGVITPSDVVNQQRRFSSPGNSDDSHQYHLLYQNANTKIHHRRQSSLLPTFTGFDPDSIADSLISSAALHGDLVRTQVVDTDKVHPPPQPLKHQLPEYLKPLPPRMTSVDIDYLFAKGALSLPALSVRNALLHAYVEYVHPYMPLVDMIELLQIIDDPTGHTGKLSLLLFQAIMFAGTAFVDMEYLRVAGYTNRKSARKAFFQKARVLYDFDYEVDRISLVQSLLLMTYWYETPDDQKDTWHWMGVAISLAHTIGLHRNPENSNMPLNKKKLWKRIWWSCFMRDRLIALGMRRPTRVKDEDYDVPMLTEDDFEIEALPDSNKIVPSDSLIRDTATQMKLAQMCICKAKLCLCVSHVLSAQYSVLVRHSGVGEGITTTGVMLFPKKLDQTDEVKRCDVELSNWVAELPEACKYSDDTPQGNSPASVFIQRALLHMVYYTTLSALHRPQVLPSASPSHPDSARELQDLSRKKVREASRQITRISQDIHTRGLEKYLPTTGVTVLLPAIIIHLLDIKSCNDEARQLAMEGFCQCMQVLEKLRDNYSSADFATQFLEAAIRKADIELVINQRNANIEPVFASEKVRQMRAKAMRTTPPPGDDLAYHPAPQHFEQAMNLHTPPETNSEPSVSHDYGLLSGSGMDMTFHDTGVDLNDYLNFDTTNEMWNVPLEEGAHGESGGFMDDMYWVGQPSVRSRLNSPTPEDMFPLSIEAVA